MYRVKLPGVAPVDIILQRNALESQPGNVMIQTFDLKGSSFRRNVMSNSIFEGNDSSIKAGELIF